MNVPKLRFKEFTDEWVTCTINSVAEVISGGTPDTTNSNYWDGSINWFTPSEVGKSKYISNSKRKITQLGLQKSSAKLLPVGTILLSSRATVGESSILSNNEACTNQGFQSLIPHKNINNEFLYYLIYKYKKSLLKQAFGSTFLEISKNNVEKIKINIPTAMKEQVKLSTFLSLLDKKIELQTKKIEALKLFKKGLVTILFNNLKVFKKYKLGALCNITTGKLDANAMRENGKYRFYTCAKDYSFIDSYAFDTEALLISGNGAYVGYIHYYKGKFNAYQRTYVLNNFTQNVQFIKCYLEQNLSKRINSEKKEGNTPYIVLSTLSDMIIKIPNKEEQIKISNIINYYNSKIELENKKLVKLYELKKGFMQSMFV